MNRIPITERDPGHKPEFVRQKGWIARLYGIITIAAGVWNIEAPLPASTTETILDVIGLALVAYGTTDLITGKHHIIPVAISYLIEDFIEDRANINKSK